MGRYQDNRQLQFEWKPPRTPSIPGSSNRQCINCGKDLSLEPAIMKGLAAFLCFPCRYHFDQEEAKSGFVYGSDWVTAYNLYIDDCRSYRQKLISYSKTRIGYETAFREWQEKCEEIKRKKSRDIATFSIVAKVALLISGAAALVLLCGLSDAYRLLLFLPIIVGMLVLFRLRRMRLAPIEAPPAPRRPAKPVAPEEPLRYRLFRFSDMRVVFDGNKAADGDLAFVTVPGYPPDWETRAARCIQRDDYKCRLCGSEQHQDFPLLVHHVVPVIQEPIHSLQNFLTVCEACHDECHKHLAHLTVEVVKPTATDTDKPNNS